MLSQETLESVMEEITLAHMEIPVDRNALLLYDYPGAEREFALAIVQGYYSRFLEDLGKEATNHYYMEKALRHSKYLAVKRVTTELHDLVDRTGTFLLDEAARTRWFSHDDFAGWDTVEDLLASMADATEEGSSTYYDMSFIAEKLLPVARTMGIDPGNIINASLQTRKLRAMVPAARMTLNQLESELITPGEAREAISWMFEVVANPRISKSTAQEQFDVYRGKRVQQLEKIPSFKVHMPGGAVWFVVPTHSGPEMRTIEMALGKTVDARLMDLGELSSLLRRKLRGED